MAESKSQAAAGVQTSEKSTLEMAIEGEFRPKTAQARVEIERAIRTMAEQALLDSVVVSDDVIGTIKAMIASIDAKLTEQVNVILHNAKFQQLESAWRGLHYLVSNTETGADLQIRVMNISKSALAKTLKTYQGATWDQSPIFRKVYEKEFGTPGGAPFGCLIGDYHFDHTAPDVATLGQMAQVAAAAHAPFISGAGSSLLRMDSWEEVQNPRDIKDIFRETEYAAWNSLRDSEDAKYIGLAMPRFMARMPYGARNNPIEEFEFEEETGLGDHDAFVWSNAAYAMAANINRSFKEYGWCSAIRGYETGGVVEDLPMHQFSSDDGGTDLKCPTEVSITDRREKELADAGLMALQYRKNTNQAMFVGAQSLQKPQTYKGKGGPDATANANLASRLSYLFATCRFGHYLKCMVRDKVGGFTSRTDLERYLTVWINDYVLEDPTDAGPKQLAETPLQGAKVIVEDVEGNPGFYTARFELRPHYQLEGVDITMSLVSKLEPKS